MQLQSRKIAAMGLQKQVLQSSFHHKAISRQPGVHQNNRMWGANDGMDKHESICVTLKDWPKLVINRKMIQAADKIQTSNILKCGRHSQSHKKNLYEPKQHSREQRKSSRCESNDVTQERKISQRGFMMIGGKWGLMTLEKRLPSMVVVIIAVGI